MADGQSLPDDARRAFRLRLRRRLDAQGSRDRPRRGAAQRRSPARRGPRRSILRRGAGHGRRALGYLELDGAIQSRSRLILTTDSTDRLRLSLSVLSVLSVVSIPQAGFLAREFRADTDRLGFGGAALRALDGRGREGAAFPLGGLAVVFAVVSAISSTCARTQCSKSRPCGRPSRSQIW